ncbi:metallophosphoesterase [Telluribacter sp. SYSU D00476]|uniref:metallophosphoesterase n=1 Tax=Telluribacter sp. SYSU D00476 TaxID=2811430 RepID=UPI001FF5A1D9|nr:metallophosphoesterase [Telluribacter sp. SYSU D00476]
MYILAIGDIHGRDVWKEIIGTRADQVVFIGDYVDSRGEVEASDIVRNFKEIIQFKQDLPDRVTLLLGNHDIQYLYYPGYRCSGFRADLQPTYTDIFTRHADLFNVAYQYQNYLFTHAGVSEGWCRSHFRLFDRYRSGYATFADMLNALHRSADNHILFDVGTTRGGLQPYGGPVWADKSETEADYLDGYHQVVGHSRVDHFIRVGDEAASITYIDVLTKRTDFYRLDLP